jgi:hypothetical protein
MLYLLAAQLLLVSHLCFVLFAAAGGLLALRWPRLAFAHLPAVLWGAAIELGGWICPLTPLENSLRRSAGYSGYEGGFIEHYLLALVYPRGLTREMQIGLGIALLVVNALVYGLILTRRRRSTSKSTADSSGTAAHSDRMRRERPDVTECNPAHSDPGSPRR